MGHMGYMGTPLLIAPMFCARRHISTTVRIYSIFNYLNNIFKSITHKTHQEGNTLRVEHPRQRPVGGHIFAQGLPATGFVARANGSCKKRVAML